MRIRAPRPPFTPFHAQLGDEQRCQLSPRFIACSGGYGLTHYPHNNHDFYRTSNPIANSQFRGYGAHKLQERRGPQVTTWQVG